MGVKVTTPKDRVDDIRASIAALTKNQLLVGVPDSTAERKDDGDGPISNAAIGYIQEFGSPSRNIPPRPHLVPGVKSALPDVVTQLRAGAVKALDGDVNAVENAQMKAGLKAARAVQKRVMTNIPPPLSPSTVRARWGRQEARKGTPVPEDFAQSQVALVSTGQYLRSITYVIRQRGKGDGSS